MSNFKVRYIRLNKPCQVKVKSLKQVKGIYRVTEVYFKEYEDTFDAFYIVEGEIKAGYIKAVNMSKRVFVDTIKTHINTLNSGNYDIDIDDLYKPGLGYVIIHKPEKLLEDIYGKE